MSMDLQHLESLVGEWTTHAGLPGVETVAPGRTAFECLEGVGEICEDGETWRHAVALTYSKVT